MTEEELSLFSEFLEQREYAGPVKVQNKIRKNSFVRSKNPYTSEIKVRKALGKEITPDLIKNERGLVQAERRFMRRMPGANLGWVYGGEGSPRQDQKAMKSSIHDRINSKSEAIKLGRNLDSHRKENRSNPGLFKFID